VLHSTPEHIALTGSTTDGVNTILAGLDLRAGDEIITSDEEHPGLLAPLGRAVRTRGVQVRLVPFAELPGEVTSQTKLIACSHVSWVGGKVADVPALRATGVPVLLDAAQSIGAVPADVDELGCDFYAASGQKWLCGPEGSGCLYVRPDRREELQIAWPGYGSIAGPEHALELTPAEGARRFDHGFPPGVRSIWALTSLAVFEHAGWDWVHERAASLAASLADGLRARGVDVAPRGRSTLVSWPAEDPVAAVEQLAAEHIVVRSIPAAGLVRASVGAWSDEDDLARLVAAAV
jgi:L-cysteine/cystine lyase